MVATRKRARLKLPARDELRDPLLSALTLVLIFLIFVIVPLHAAGTIEFKGYGFFVVLLLASCVLMQSTRWTVLFFLSLGLGLAAAGAILRSRSLSPLDLRLGHHRRDADLCDCGSGVCAGPRDLSSR